MDKWSKTVQLFVKYRLTASNIPLVADEIEKRNMPAEAEEHRELGRKYRHFADDLERALIEDGVDLTMAYEILAAKEDKEKGK